MLIIETTCNRLYRVEEFTDPRLDHVWRGVPVIRVRGAFVERANAKPELVRKEGSRVIARTQSA